MRQKQPGDLPANLELLTEHSKQTCPANSSAEAQTCTMSRSERNQAQQTSQADLLWKREDACPTGASFCKWKNQGGTRYTYLHFRKVWAEVAHSHDKEITTSSIQKPKNWPERKEQHVLWTHDRKSQMLDSNRGQSAAAGLERPVRREARLMFHEGLQF